MKLVHLTAGAALLLAGCAQNATDIHAAYVSPVPYQAMNCVQLGQEATRVSVALQTATAMQNQQAQKDAVAVGLGMLVAWPTLLLVGGNKQDANSIATLKGAQEVIVEVNEAKHCPPLNYRG